MDDFTVYPLPRYRPIVFALVGDSTITRRPRPVTLPVPFVALAALEDRVAARFVAEPFALFGVFSIVAVVSADPVVVDFVGMNVL
jgi:hypothetical protein